MANKKRPEQIAGSFGGIPHSVMDSVAFTGASHRAKALLLELIRQLNGSNNGHLQLATSSLKVRGWSSADQIQKAKVELIGRQLIVKTRLGGLNAGSDLWAVTWLIVSNYVGLDLRTGKHTPGAWHYFAESEQRKKHSVRRNSAVPHNGIAPPTTAPHNGTKNTLLPTAAVPCNGNNVFTNVLDTKGRKRIVGKSGKIG